MISLNSFPQAVFGANPISQKNSSSSKFGMAVSDRFIPAAEENQFIADLKRTIKGQIERFSYQSPDQTLLELAIETCKNPDNADPEKLQSAGRVFAHAARAYVPFRPAPDSYDQPLPNVITFYNQLAAIDSDYDFPDAFVRGYLSQAKELLIASPMTHDEDLLNPTQRF